MNAANGAVRLRPRDAASIILIDRGGDRLRLLMGRRSSAHAFMPDLYVFPGGRRDPADGRVAVARDLHPLVRGKLAERAGTRMTARRARALAVAAVRETCEETGLALAGPASVAAPDWPDWPAPGGDGERPLAPDLSPLRYVARAITPPRRNRRYDTRFFSCFLDEAGIRPDAVRDSRELHDLRWVTFEEVDALALPAITRAILAELWQRLAADPALGFAHPVPFFFDRHGRAAREEI